MAADVMPVMHNRALRLVCTAILVAVYAGALRASEHQAQAPPRDPSAITASATGVLAGTVVATTTGQAVARAMVSVTGGTPKVVRVVETDARGGFRADQLPPGDYLVSVSKPGYLDSTFGQVEPGSGRPGTVIRLIAGQRRENLRVPLARGAAVSGNVVEDTGEPAFGASVSVYRWTMKAGERTLVPAGDARTDDRGTYRIGLLTPGEYIVAVEPEGETFKGHITIEKDSGWSAVSVDFSGRPTSMEAATARFIRDATAAKPEPSRGFASVYYSGARTVATALSIELAPGEERFGVDFRLLEVPFGSVTGVVTGPDGPVEDTVVEIIGVNQPPGFGSMRTSTNGEGRFTFFRVQPGQYRLEARALPASEMPEEEVRRRMAAGETEAQIHRFIEGEAVARKLWASAEVTADGSALDGVQLMLRPGVTVHGHVVVVGNSGPRLDVSKLSLMLEPVGQGKATSPAAKELPRSGLGPSGDFTIRGVMPGRYRVAAADGLPPGYAIRSAQYAGQDLMDFPLVLAGHEQPTGVVVTLATGATTVTGLVRDAAAKPTAAATVIAYAADARFWTPQSRRIQAVRPTSDGTFAIGKLPPGDYRLVAVPDVEDGRWFDPEYLRSLGGFVTFSLTEGGAASHDLRVK